MKTIIIAIAIVALLSGTSFAQTTWYKNLSNGWESQNCQSDLAGNITCY